MKIERKDGVKVEDIEVGECFLLDGDVCLKVSPGNFEGCITDKFTQCYIDLEGESTIERLTPEYRVKPLKAKIVIE